MDSLPITSRDQFVIENALNTPEVVSLFVFLKFDAIRFLHIFSPNFLVDSQQIKLGSDDTSNDLTGGEEYDDEDYVASGSNHGNDPNPLNKGEEMDLYAFAELAKQLEGERLQRLSPSERMNVSNVAYSDLEMVEEDDEWPIERFLRLQDDEPSGTRGRLTAPAGETRKRKRAKKTTPDETNAMVDELRSKQLALVNEQLELHKILQETALINRENASIAKEEAMERLAMVKVQRQIAEIELQAKRMNSNS